MQHIVNRYVQYIKKQFLKILAGILIDHHYPWILYLDEFQSPVQPLRKIYIKFKDTIKKHKARDIETYKHDK